MQDLSAKCSSLFDSAPPNIQNKALAELKTYEKSMSRIMRDRIEKYRAELLEEIIKSYIVANEYKPERKK